MPTPKIRMTLEFTQELYDAIQNLEPTGPRTFQSKVTKLLAYGIMYEQGVDTFTPSKSYEKAIEQGE